jgi:hypothetical protein
MSAATIDLGLKPRSMPIYRPQTITIAIATITTGNAPLADTCQPPKQLYRALSSQRTRASKTSGHTIDASANHAETEMHDTCGILNSPEARSFKLQVILIFAIDAELSSNWC